MHFPEYLHSLRIVNEQACLGVATDRPLDESFSEFRFQFSPGYLLILGKFSSVEFWVDPENLACLLREIFEEGPDRCETGRSGTNDDSSSFKTCCINTGLLGVIPFRIARSVRPSSEAVGPYVACIPHTCLSLQLCSEK